MAEEGEDCYFYYYSTCRKGLSCPFRHEPLSRGTEATCEDWEYGRCIKEHCPFRHMRIQVNRSTVACYWESQPTGCQKRHCAFRHFKTRNTTEVNATPTDDAEQENTNVPSPKVDQILIQVADTDDDSPHKTVRIKPAFPKNRLAKKLLLRSSGKTKDSVTDLEQKQASKAKNSSQSLEDELLECAKQGIYIKPGSEVTKTIVNSSFPVKVKSLKDIKREKVLRARLEYERKKLLASQQMKAGEDNQPEVATAAPKVAERNSAVEMTKINDSQTRVKAVKAAQLSTTSKQRNTNIKAPSRSQLSTQLEVSNATASPVAEVRVKSFSEIMEEKRRRLGELQSSRDHGDTEEELNVDAVKKPVIAARKIKLHRNANGKPSRLKRPAPPDPVDESPPKDEKRCKNKETEGDSHKAIESVPYSENDKSHGSEPATNECLKRTSNEDRTDLDVDEEFYLLDSSDYGLAQTNAAAIDIDDDDFMNEMEQLLA